MGNRSGGNSISVPTVQFGVSWEGRTTWGAWLGVRYMATTALASEYTPMDVLFDDGVCLGVGGVKRVSR